MKRIRTIAVLPTLLTIGNLICGFFAIVVASRINSHAPSEYDTTNVMIAGYLIFAAMIFDALDGQVARLARITSDFGAQLDSLCDMVTFGVAPGFLLVKMCPDFHLVQTDPQVLNPFFPGLQTVWVIAALFAACAAMRLARFNVESGEDDDHLHFNGLPSPAAAATLASFAVMFYTLRRGNAWFLPYLKEYGVNLDWWLQMILPFFAAAVALLMVSRIRYPHLVNQLVRGNRSFSHVVRVLFALMAVMITLPYSLPIVCGLFAIVSPIRYSWEVLVQRRTQEEPMF